MTVLSGLSAFVVTPLAEDGTVDCDHLGRLVDRLRLDGISSIGVLGSTGGYMYLSASERMQALSAAVEAAKDKPVLAGIGDLTTAAVVHHARNAEAAGVGALLLAPVTYLPLSQAEVHDLFCDVAAASDLPLCFYDNPGTTGFTPQGSLVTDLAKAGTIQAVKNPPAQGGDFAGKIAEQRDGTPDDFLVGFSGDAAIAGALDAGCDAWYSVLAGTLPKPAIALWKARHDKVELERLNTQLAPLWKTFNAYGSIRVIYEIANKIGQGPVAFPAPLQPLGDEARTEIDGALAALDDLL